MLVVNVRFGFSFARQADSLAVSLKAFQKKNESSLIG